MRNGGTSSGILTPRTEFVIAVACETDEGLSLQRIGAYVKNAGSNLLRSSQNR
jgi:hypothetical protein